MTLNGCETGEAKITKGYKLKAKYIIHTVEPIYRDGKHNEAKLLANCYYNSLKLAKDNKIKSIAFSLTSSGIFGYPNDETIDAAINAIKKFGSENKDYDMEVILCFYKNISQELKIRRKQYDKIKSLFYRF